VTWNPLLSEIEATPGSTKVFDSANIPGEIIDVMMVNTETLADNPDFGKALTGAWYEVMGLMAAGNTEALESMAAASGTDLAGYQAQLDTTKMFFEPAEAVSFTKSAELPATMKFVAEFLFDKGILGEGAPSPEFVGVLVGFLPYVRSTLSPFIASISLIPPITILPILFIMVGLGETSKILLIALGTAPVMTRSVAQAVMDLPKELIIKAQTLGASTWQMMTRVVLPQVLPNLITAMRLGLVPAWIFLISAEAIASTSGLGYRIFLVRRFLAMDVILPYVLWITFLAYLIDRLLLTLSRRAFPWNHMQGESL
jgi:ABC-type proline/glycine betaine transport system permease subunit